MKKIRFPFPTSRNDELRGGAGWDRIEKSLQNITKRVNDLTMTINMVTPMDFGAVGDGLTDDSIAINAAIDYCINNDTLLKIDKIYKVSNIDSIISDQLYIDGTNGGLITTGNNAIQFSANHYNIALAETFSADSNKIVLSDASKCNVGDTITIISKSAVETSYNTKATFTAKIVDISSNTVTLNDTCPFSFDTDSIITLFKNAYLIINNLSVLCNTENYYTSITVTGINLIANNIRIDGNSNNYGFTLSNCIDSIINSVYCNNVIYGFLVNGCNRIIFNNLFCGGSIRHITALGNFSKNITVIHAKGNGALIESHTAIDPAFIDCDFIITNESWNLRSLGGIISNCKIQMGDDVTSQNILIQSISFTDSSIWDYANLYIDKCNIDINGNINIRNGYNVEITNNIFKTPTIIYYGETTSSKIYNCKISNNHNLLRVSASNRDAAIISTNDNIANAVIDDDTYVIDHRGLPGYRISKNISAFSAKGCIIPHMTTDATGKITIPIKIYYDGNNVPQSDIVEILSSMEIDIFSQYASTRLDHANIKLAFAVNSNNNYTHFDTPIITYMSTEDPIRLSVNIANFSADGNSVSTSPYNHCYKFDLEITPSTTTYAWRVFAHYKSFTHCLREAY